MNDGPLVDPWLPRWHEVHVPLVESNPTGARVGRVLVANLPDGYRRATVKVELSFDVSAAPALGSMNVVPIRNTQNLGQGYDLRPGPAVQAIGAASVAGFFDAGEPAFGDVVLDGVDAIELSNTMDVNVTNVRVGFKVISQPSVETGR